MQNFTFTLDRVLRLRADQLKIAETQFKRLLSERGEIEAEIGEPQWGQKFRSRPLPDSAT